MQAASASIGCVGLVLWVPSFWAMQMHVQRPPHLRWIWSGSTKTVPEARLNFNDFVFQMLRVTWALKKEPREGKELCWEHGNICGWQRRCLHGACRICPRGQVSDVCALPGTPAAVSSCQRCLHKRHPALVLLRTCVSSHMGTGMHCPYPGPKSPSPPYATQRKQSSFNLFQSIGCFRLT